MRRAALVGLLTAGGCVYPTTEPTGLELSWRFVESNQVDGEDMVRALTCPGATTEQVAIDIRDVADPLRAGTFRFDCTVGYQTAIAVQTEASDAFVHLDAGTYDLTVNAVDEASNAPVAEVVGAREVDVEARGVSIATWELHRTPVEWDLELSGADACTQLRLTLRYAAAESGLAGFDPTEEGGAPVYRAALRSDGDLPVGGESIACSADLDGTHRFTGIDRADYLLELDVDGLACAVRVDLRGRQGASSVIDLANLPCGG